MLWRVLNQCTAFFTVSSPSRVTHGITHHSELSFMNIFAVTVHSDFFSLTYLSLILNYTFGNILSADFTLLEHLVDDRAIVCTTLHFSLGFKKIGRVNFTAYIAPEATV